MKKLCLLIILFTSQWAMAQDAKPLLREVNRKFNLVNDYNANVAMKFFIPGVKLNGLNGKVLFKKPNKFRIKAKGIFFLPKQNPMQNIGSMLLDTNNYNTLISGYEVVNGKNCAVVNLIPNKTSDELILGKFWIDVKNPLVIKSQITTKNNGTVETESFYGSQTNNALPDKVIIMIDVNKVKVPKMMAVDLKRKSQPKEEDKNIKEKGKIELYFTGYKINQKIDDAEFVKE